jgi:hypothetical protein
LEQVQALKVLALKQAQALALGLVLEQALSSGQVLALKLVQGLA